MSELLDKSKDLGMSMDELATATGWTHRRVNDALCMIPMGVRTCKRVKTKRGFQVRYLFRRWFR